LRAGAVAHAFFAQVLARARGQQLLSSEPLTVDGTLRAAWASLKSFKPKAPAPAAPPDDPGNPSVECRGETRSTATQASPPDPDARLDQQAKGPEAQLGSLGQVWRENRHGLSVNPRLTQATGTAEREAAVERGAELPGHYRGTVGGDQADDPQACVQALRAVEARPHVAQHPAGRARAREGRTTRHDGSALSQRTRKRVAELCGWQKTVGWLRKVGPRGLALVGGVFTCTAAASNWVRLQKVAEAGCGGIEGRLAGGGGPAPGSRSPAGNRAAGQGTPKSMATYCAPHCPSIEPP
jgi:hypothetical protein